MRIPQPTPDVVPGRLRQRGALEDRRTEIGIRHRIPALHGHLQCAAPVEGAVDGRLLGQPAQLLATGPGRAPRPAAAEDAAMHQAGGRQGSAEGAEPLVVREPPADRVDRPVAARADGVQHGCLDRMPAVGLDRRQLPGPVHPHPPGLDERHEGGIDHPVDAAGEEGDVVEVEVRRHSGCGHRRAPRSLRDPLAEGMRGFGPLGERDHSLYELCRTFDVRCLSCQASAAASPRLELRLPRWSGRSPAAPRRWRRTAHGRAAGHGRPGRRPCRRFRGRSDRGVALRSAAAASGGPPWSAPSAAGRGCGGAPAMCRGAAARRRAAGPRRPGAARRRSAATGSCRPNGDRPARSRRVPPPRPGAGGSARPR